MDLPLPAENEALAVAADGTVLAGHRWDPRRPSALLPGSFNPLHAGHRGLAEVAAELLGLPVAFELSIANVDKPPLDAGEVQRRVRQFTGIGDVWLTRAARFIQKAELFPGAAFVVGADTAVRLVEPRYYEGDRERMHAALARLRERACRILVACRVDAAGQCVELTDVPVPHTFRELFIAVPSARFRLDVSSTALRRGIS